MLNAPVIRPSAEDRLVIRALTAEDRRALRPGLPVVVFVNAATGARVRTRDWDLYANSQDWIEVPQAGRRA